VFIGSILKTRLKPLLIIQNWILACWRKQRAHLMVFYLTPDGYPTITS